MSIIEKECIGCCPKCGSDNLLYLDETYLDNEYEVYEFECLTCGVKGKEVFVLSYLHSSYEEDENE